MDRKRQRVFIDPDQEVVELDQGYWYVFSQGWLRIYHNEALIYETQAEAWEGFEIITIKDGTHVTPMTPPKKDLEVVMWLLGVSKRQRSENEAEYEEIREKVLQNRGEDKAMGEVSCRNFALTMLYYDGRWNNVAVWVSTEITEEEIIELVPFMTAYPSEYTKKVLKERFHIT